VEALLPNGIIDVETSYPPTPFQSLFFYCHNLVAMNRNDSGIFDEQRLIVLKGQQYSPVYVKISSQLRAIRVDFSRGYV